MNIIHYDPWRLVDRVHRDTDRFFPSRLFRTSTESPADWVPAVDIKEEDERFVIRADIPGVDAENLEITLEKSVLTIEGTRETRSEDETDDLRRTERFSGRFSRSFNLPESADSEGVVADYANGVLEVAIPKRQNAAPRRIEVKAD